MKMREYDGCKIYYVQGFSQASFPLARSGSSLPSSLIHCIRDKAILVETTYEPISLVFPKADNKLGCTKTGKTEIETEQTR
jgi:hypothetical protein